MWYNIKCRGDSLIGYTHYYRVPKKFNAKAFAKVAVDFKKMVTPLKHLGVTLADETGENYPTITPTEICFNGLTKCGHVKRELGIPWPSETAKGISNNRVGIEFDEIAKSSWGNGALLETRICGGYCSHDSFILQQKLTTEIERQDGSIYILEPEEKSKKYPQYVKTAYKPYDLAVTVCLVIAKQHLGKNIMLDSNGTINNWHEAMQLCQHFLGYGLEFSLDKMYERTKRVSTKNRKITS